MTLEPDSDIAFRMIRCGGADVLLVGNPDGSLVRKLLNEADRSVAVVSSSAACLNAATVSGAKTVIQAELADQKWSRRLRCQMFDVLIAALPMGDLDAIGHVLRPAGEQYLLSETATVVLILDQSASAARCVPLAPSGIRRLVESLDVTVEEMQPIESANQPASHGLIVRGRVSPQSRRFAAESALKSARKRVHHERSERQKLLSTSSELVVQQRKLKEQLVDASKDVEHWRRKCHIAEQHAAAAGARAARAEGCLASIEASRSWKIGRMVTSLPRWLRSWLPDRT